MAEIVFPSILLIGAFLAAWLSVLAVIGSMKLTVYRPGGFLDVIPYGIMFTSALLIAFSGRNHAMLVVTAAAPLPGVVTWCQRVVSVVMLLASMERIASHTLKHDVKSPNLALLWAFIAFWLGATAAPMMFGAHSTLSHEIFYPLIMGLAALLANSAEAGRIVITTRNAIVLFTIASWLMIPVAPGLVLDSSYSQGYIPGVPRFAGLAAHAVALGMIVQIGLYCLWVHPYRNKFVNFLGWSVLLGALFLSQAKTAWVSFAIGAIAMAQIRGEGRLIARAVNSRKPVLGIALIIIMTLTACGVVALLFMAESRSSVERFLSSKEGSQLASLTGRDQIWTAALAEWHQHPVFGYGTELLSASHRASLGMPSATHAHNQFIDTLARAGLVGAVPLLIYVWLLGWYSFKYAKHTKGLSASIFLALFIRGFSEIPFSMAGYGHEFLGHVLLLSLLAGAHFDLRRTPSTQMPQAPYAKHLAPSLP